MISIHLAAIKTLWPPLAKPIQTSPATRQGRDGFCAAQRVACKDQNDLRRRSRSGIEGAPSTALFGTANGRIKKGKRVTRFQKSNRKAGFSFG